MWINFQKKQKYYKITLLRNYVAYFMAGNKQNRLNRLYPVQNIHEK